MELLNFIPEEFINFFLVLIFSLLIGLEQRRHHINENEDLLFGTDRTFTFIGLLAYVLFIADTVNYIPFLFGFALIGLLLSIQYYHKIGQNSKYGLTSTILALLTYCIPIMVFTQPIWLVLS
ncbi:MAG: MgtC/SapB family protein, partial [Bacteroidota bacterium]|nr:MgtC/SapB family protein [Bacteroidota bacterium]